MLTSGHDVHDSRARFRTSDLFFASTLLFVTEITKNAIRSQITVLVKLRLCLQPCLTERKTGLQQHHVKICKYGIGMEHGRFFPFHTCHSMFHTNFYLPFHAIVCPACNVAVTHKERNT